MNRVENPLDFRYPRGCSQNTKSCEVNNVDLTLPKGYPRRRVPVNVTQKSIYTGIPNYYPLQYKEMPVGTIYENDFSQFQSNGKRVSYTRQMYPFTDRVVREASCWSGSIAPIIDTRFLSKHPIIHDAQLK